MRAVQVFFLLSKIYENITGADALKDAFEEMLVARYSIKAYARPTISSDEKRQYVYVERTPLLRFPDIINVQFVPLTETSSTLLLHSGSVYGYSDVGKNKQRVTEMIKSLSALPASLTRSSVQV